jgi:hypothetical protein
MKVIIRYKLAEEWEAEAIAQNISCEVSMEITDGPHISFCNFCGKGLVIEASRTVKVGGGYYHAECLNEKHRSDKAAVSV